MAQGGASKQTEEAQRGSEKMLRERGLPEKELQRLMQLSQRQGRLVYWFPKGQPVPDAVYGAVIVPPDKAGRVIDRYLKLEGLGLRLDVFPLGTPVPEEVLIRFHQGFGH